MHFYSDMICCIYYQSWDCCLFFSFFFFKENCKFFEFWIHNFFYTLTESKT